ncbi:cardiolipin synthase [Opitutus sp. GAS368]|uniref:cardiolipin synthase n=1 Tax=Opitutus sp. GAS368 TaxID=1882749 RepID=UPI00087BC747|nr:cardiolipin synthase [Opitutus sp. GAS368]SDS67079.1 cardiolipin synthase [Opitutus sp. GAS368]
METLRQYYDALLEHPFINGVLPHLLTVVGFLLAFFAIARLMSQRKQPGNTFAWLFAIAFVPYVGVPLYLMFGGRKLRKLAEKKARLYPTPTITPFATAEQNFAARVFTRSGACPPVGGNRVSFLTSGEESFERLEHSIRHAQHSIHLMTFILGRDAVGRRLVKLLAQRAREGVKVRLLLDGLGCFLTSGGFCDPIRQAGGEVVKFMPVMPLQSPHSANLRNHRKIAIFDHRVAALGGRNLAVEYMGPTPLKRRWRDLGGVVEGPAVRLLDEIFLSDWAFASGQPLAELQKELPAEAPAAAGDSEVQIVASGPDVAGDPLYEGILSLVQQAERSVWIVTPYFIPDEVLFRSLLVQARAGVDIRLVVPAKSNHPVTDLARRYYLRGLQAAGVKVLFYGPGMNHAKMLLVDGQTGLFGSANMDLRSLFLNFEVGAITYSPADAEAIGRWMKDIFAHAKPMPEPRPGRRLIPTIAEEIARLLAPLL